MHIYTNYSGMLRIVLGGNIKGERLQMTQNAHTITIFLIDCIIPITMPYICIPAGWIEIVEDFILAVCISMMCCQYVIFFYDFALSLSVHVLLLCRPTGWIHYFAMALSTHCTPRTTRLFKNRNFYSHLVPSPLRCKIYTFISFSWPQMCFFFGVFFFFMPFDFWEGI